jgi:hypothetical protein
MATATRLASVFPTKMVHRKFSGLSRYPCNVAARAFPSRIQWRMRSRLSANTPASMPERKKLNPVAIAKANSQRVFMV